MPTIVHILRAALGIVVATLAILALAPATRDIAWFDRQLVLGARPFATLALQAGIAPADFPAPAPAPLPAEPDPAPLPDRETRLASATRLAFRQKSAAPLHNLARDEPRDPAVLAALLRTLCWPPADANRAREILAAATAGERLEPDNAFFPAMAAVGHVALREPGDARAALHRAAQAPRWNEYIEVEARGAIRRAERLHGPLLSLGKPVILQSLLFPHYSRLRALAREMAAQRRDLETLGARMRAQATTGIGNAVGIAIEKIAGARSQEAATAARAVLDAGPQVSATGVPALAVTGIYRLVGSVLLSVTLSFLVLASVAFLWPRWARRSRPLAFLVASAIVASFSLWQIGAVALGFRDLLGYLGLIDGLAGGEGNAVATGELLALGRQQGRLLYGALALPPLFLAIVVLVARGRGVGVSALLRAGALPVAALMALGYAAHTAVAGTRESALNRELDRAIVHEGRYLAGKLGNAWPEERR